MRMKYESYSYKDINVNLIDPNDKEEILAIATALSNEKRYDILIELSKTPILTFRELQDRLNISKSALEFHLALLEKASLIVVRYKNSSSGTIRIIGRDAKSLYVGLYKPIDHNVNPDWQFYNTSLGVGMFSKYEGYPLSYVTTEREFQNENIYRKERYEASLIFTSMGLVTYTFPLELGTTKEIEEIKFSFELCSEAPLYDNDYKSDISFFVDGIFVETYVSSGDYGDRRGKLNPSWWSDRNTQYGKLIVLKINSQGVFINGILVNSKINIKDFDLTKKYIELKLGNEKTSKYVGGFNLFGKDFGDYPIDIELSVGYKV